MKENNKHKELFISTHSGMININHPKKYYGFNYIREKRRNICEKNGIKKSILVY